MGENKFKPLEFYITSIEKGETIALYSCYMPLEYSDLEYVFHLTYTSSKKEKVKVKFLETKIKGYFSTIEEIDLFDDKRVYYNPRGESYFIEAYDSNNIEEIRPNILVNFSDYETSLKDLNYNEKNINIQNILEK